MKTYTLKVTLPDAGKVSRTIEMAAEQTLHELHFAIQDAFEWDADHLYSFFMSGKAWDQESEYTIPEAKLDNLMFGLLDEEWDDDDDGDEVEDEDEENEDEADLDIPQTPEERQAFFNALQNMSEEDAAQLAKMMQDEIGVPEFIAGMMLDFVKNLGEDELEMLLDSEKMDAFFDDDEAAGDATVATLDSLHLSKKKTFMYLFDYGDEWRFKVQVQAINEHAADDITYPRLVAASGDAPPQYPVWDEEDEEEWDEDESGEDPDLN